MMVAQGRGRESVKGARSDAHRLVWVFMFALEAGETRSVREIADQVDPQRDKLAGDDRQRGWTVVRALRIAAAMRLVSCVELPRPAGHRRQVWSRLAWPRVVNVEWLVSVGASPTIARNVLLALETAGWLKADFRRAR